MANLFDFIYVIFNEIRSYFVPEKIRYEITGECKKCGKCCNYMYSKDTYTEKEFKIMQFLFPAYKRFYIKGKDDDGNLIFACKLVTKDGLCSDYKNKVLYQNNHAKALKLHLSKEHSRHEAKVKVSFDCF